VVVLFDAAHQRAAKAAEEVSHEIFRAALDLGGTISGEHGIGLAKRDYLSWQLSPAVLALSNHIKRQLDAEGSFNPGKVFV